jgi:DNA-directed RNA polymerase subunit beta'
MKNNLKQQLVFNNEVINKKKLQKLMYLTFQNYGIIKSSLIADRVKNLTFHYATMSGISLSIEDLRVPFRKRSLIGLTTNEVDITEQNYNGGNITAVERFQKVIDIWNNANNTLKDEVLTYFRESDPLNPLYIMAFSGARGNISQVRQLVGMRGLMADPQGEIIDLPIKSNFREGLEVTEYIISSYGARKGLVDTALRTADSGYLTRRLVDVAQDIIIREEDCLTQEGLSLDDLFKKYHTDLSLEDRLMGRLLAKPVTIPDENITIEPNTAIDSKLVNLFKSSKVTNIEVRSPLTCNALRSVCRKCYGWHLSYSKIIDLGEAVGILAAQSIGEPGTQLTMRTFHTGGVFSGDLTKQIRAPFAGTLEYDLKSSTSLVRTIHGEKGFELLENITLQLENGENTKCSLDIPNGAMLLANNGQKVYCNQVVAEIKKEANLILEEDRRDVYTEVSGEVFLQNIKLEETVDGEGATKKVSKTTGLVWVLYGDHYSLQGFSKLEIGLGQKFLANQTIANQKIVNTHPGIVCFDKTEATEEIKIITSAMTVENGSVKNLKGRPDIFELSTAHTKKRFNLNVQPNQELIHGQTIACLEDDTYKTKTGGVIYYSIANFPRKKKRSTKKIFTGSLYWVPEETHKLSLIDLEQLKIKSGEFVRINTSISSTIFTQISGFVEIDEETSELIVKPGELYQIETIEDSEKVNRFVKPGEVIFPQITAQKLSFLEFVNFYGKDYVLIRPVSIFNVPQDKGFFFKYKFFPDLNNRNVAFRTVKRIFYKDGEKVKSSNGGVNLLQTYLVLDMRKKSKDLHAKIEYLPLREPKESSITNFKLRLILYEQIKAKTTGKSLNDQLFVKHLVSNYQYVAAKTIIAKIDLVAKVGGTLVATSMGNNIEMLVLKDKNIKKCFYSPKEEKLCVKTGDLVRVGTFLTSKLRSKYAGHVYMIDENSIFIRLGKPHLISEGAILRAGNKSLVDRSDMLATLVYDKLKTVDIVQGLPKVEEILEARKIKNGCLLSPTEGKAYFKNTKIEIVQAAGDKLIIDTNAGIKVNFSNGKYVNFLEPLTDGPINPHEKLETLFTYYQLRYPINEACKKSFKHLQLFLVNEVQRTYLSQGVQIADKHIEIIVKQMTSKVRVSYGGDTTLLPGEIIEINQAELVTKTTSSINDEPPVYKPMLLGLTKASLNSDSFISAASFQETTRVLTEAAIEGKKDWLNGLKENVIIGRLIPAGTGFNCFENLKKVGKNKAMDRVIKPSKDYRLKAHILRTRLN